MTEVEETRDQAQDLKEEMTEIIEAEETKDQAQDLKEEKTEVEKIIIKIANIIIFIEICLKIIM